MYEVDCPYCDHSNEIEDESISECGDGDSQEHDCTSCDKMFMLDVSHSIDVDSRKPDCEDDLDEEHTHNYKLYKNRGKIELYDFKKYIGAYCQCDICDGTTFIAIDILDNSEFTEEDLVAIERKKELRAEKCI